MLNPLNAVYFFTADFVRAFIAMGSVVLAVTGAEALYADMGHFGRKPIRVSWLYFVLPALLLNYMGQGAMILSAAPHEALAKVKDPFFYLAPDMFRLPLVLLATAATIIASQAVISGAFSVTQQAIQLGFVPRLRITHTSEAAAGQIYIPVINWALMTMVIVLVLTFRSSSNLAAAYGIAVTGAMLIDSVLISVVLRQMWNWNRYRCRRLAGALLHGRLLLSIGQPAEDSRRRLVPAAGRRDRLHLPDDVGEGPAADDQPHERGEPADGDLHQVGGAQRRARAGHGGLHDQLGERRAARAAAQPQAQQGAARARDPADRQDRGRALRVGRETGRAARTTARASTVSSCATASWRRSTFRRRSRSSRTAVPQCKMMDTSFFLARQTLLASSRPGMAIWREKLFAWMLRNAESAMEFFKLPTNRVVELGSQVEI